MNGRNLSNYRVDALNFSLIYSRL